MTKKSNFNTIWIQSKKPNNFDVPDHDLHYKQKSFNLPSVKSSMVTHCSIPWNTLTIDTHGRIFTCICDGWVPFSVGKVSDFSNFDELFSSPQARLTQESIINKEYKYCATKFCGIETKNILSKDDVINLNINLDISCNLSCPSCRERLIFINDKEILKEKMQSAKIIYSWLINSQKKIVITFGGGDPFSSLVYLDIMKLFSTVENVVFIIKTNGILLKHQLSKFNMVIDRIVEISVSIDAATPETYELIRRGGKWNTLIENLEYLKSISICDKNLGNFVIQRDNIDDIIPFIDLCNRYDLIPWFDVVQDWGTWHNYQEHCVHLPDSPYYEKFKNIFNSPVFEQNNIDISRFKQWM